MQVIKIQGNHSLKFGVDLRDYRWSARTWDRLTSVYPYRLSTSEPLGRTIAEMTGADVPLLRGDWMLAGMRRIKEELVDFDNRPLFTPRKALTQPFELSRDEKLLYDDVTEYINTFLPRQSGGPAGL